MDPDSLPFSRFPGRWHIVCGNVLHGWELADDALPSLNVDEPDRGSTADEADLERWAWESPAVAAENDVQHGTERTAPN